MYIYLPELGLSPQHHQSRLLLDHLAYPLAPVKPSHQLLQVSSGEIFDILMMLSKNRLGVGLKGFDVVRSTPVAVASSGGAFSTYNSCVRRFDPPDAYTPRAAQALGSQLVYSNWQQPPLNKGGCGSSQASRRGLPTLVGGRLSPCRDGLFTGF